MCCSKASAKHSPEARRRPRRRYLPSFEVSRAVVPHTLTATACCCHNDHGDHRTHAGCVSAHVRHRRRREEAGGRVCGHGCHDPGAQRTCRRGSLVLPHGQSSTHHNIAPLSNQSSTLHNIAPLFRMAPTSGFEMCFAIGSRHRWVLGVPTKTRFEASQFIHLIYA